MEAMVVDAGKLIVEARLHAGLTQAKLARRAGTSQAMVARYETGAASPTVAALQRLLRAAGHELVLASRPAGDGGSAGYGDLSRSPVIELRRHRFAIRAAATKLRARNVRISGPAVRGGAPLRSRADLLVNFPVSKRGLLPLLTLACQVEEIAGQRVDVIAEETMVGSALARAVAEAMPL
jgi:transcriptional regulator with XRE-family HTH domain